MTASTNTLPPERLSPEDLSRGLTSFLKLDWLQTEPELGQGRRADARIRLTRRDESKTFIVEYKKTWTASALSSAIQQVREYARLSPGDLPLVVLPYLSEDHLETLLAAEVSGLDLVGNGVLTADPWLLMFSRGENTFRNPQVVKSPYQGKSALVARTLLACPFLPTAEALRAELRKRGGEVSQPVVSRALKAFRDDLIVGSQAGQGIVLLQPEKLLDRLTQQWAVTVDRWKAQGHTVLWRGRVEGEPATFLPRMFAQPRLKAHQVVMTGLTSAGLHTNLTLEKTQYLYSNSIGSLLDDVKAEQTRRFPNLELWFPPDEAVFFDAVTDEEGVRWASAWQTYLDMATGDTRLQESAKELRAALLNETSQKRAALLAQAGAA